MLRFMRYRYLYFLISALVLVPGIFSLSQWGLRPAIDFTGGSLWEIRITQEKDQGIPTEKIEETLGQAEAGLSSIQISSEKTYLLRLKPLSPEAKTQLTKKLEENFGQVEEIRFETVGPTLGKELMRKTLIALSLAAGFILFYIAYQFKDKKFGICAVLAMLHDSLVLLGVFSLLGHFFQVEVDTLFVTAVLTTLSFSVHDTIVVYDRIRESRRIFPKADFEDLVDKAVSETLGRSVNNSMTIIFMLLALYLLGGETTKWFVFALLIGAISGTYSSTFTAAPLLVVWNELVSRKKQGRENSPKK